MKIIRSNIIMLDFIAAGLVAIIAALLTTFADAPATAQQLAVAAAPANINIRSAPYNAKGNGSTDDTAAIQRAFTASAAGGTITIPPGTYLTTAPLNLNGDGVHLVGESGSVIIVNHHFTGAAGTNGIGIVMLPTFGPPIYSPVPTDVDGSIFITNGRGATALIEAATGGAITAPGSFNELAPCEFIGRGPLLGTYSNIAAAGTPPSEANMHYLRITTPCRNITIENIAFDFADASADSSIQIKYGQNILLKNISVMRTPTVTGGQGEIGMTGCQNCEIENVQSPNIAIALNSCRECAVEKCDVKSVTMEESCIGNTIAGNTIRATGTIGIRTNDNGCSRNIIAHNTIINAAANMGAIGIWEGIDNIVVGNVCRDGDDVIWAGGSGNVITGNVSSGVSDYTSKNIVK